MTRHFLSVADLSAVELRTVLGLARELQPPAVLSGHGAALLFEHPSARTRNAAEMAVAQLGGHPVSIRGEELAIDRRESAEDVARTLACYHSLVAARVADHSVLVRMSAALDAAGLAVPVVNLLSDEEHPTQALADLLTLVEALGELQGRVLAYVGDANNVCRSLAYACALSGMAFHVASPDGYALGPGAAERARRLGGTVRLFSSPAEAVAGCDAVYTDVWASMGQEAERPERLSAFRGYSVDAQLLAEAASGAVFMHCLPAHRGEEVSADVLDSASSVVWQQAGNRLHALRGLLLFLLGAPLGGHEPLASAGAEMSRAAMSGATARGEEPPGEHGGRRP